MRVMSDSQDNDDINIYVHYHEYDYNYERPTVVIQGTEFGSAGYDLDISTGELTRCCICAAWGEHECTCGYDWGDE